MADYKFKGHQSFYIRNGWLYKGITVVQKDKDVFQKEFAQDTFGLGSNMVIALRYWLQATGLTREGINEDGEKEKGQFLSPWGRIVFDFDRHFEDLGTLCYLQYKLALNEKLATSWYYFFNIFDHNEFTKNDLSKAILNHYSSESFPYTAKLMKKSMSESSISGDVDCLVKTYYQEDKETDIENNKFCPLQRLNLLERIQGRRDLYRKIPLRTENIDPRFFYAMILSHNLQNSRGEQQVNFDTLLNRPGSIGKVFNLDFQSLLQILEKMQRYGLARITNTAGLDLLSFNVKETGDGPKVLRDYYQNGLKD